MERRYTRTERLEMWYANGTDERPPSQLYVRSVSELIYTEGYPDQERWDLLTSSLRGMLSDSDEDQRLLAELDAYEAGHIDPTTERSHLISKLVHSVRLARCDIISKILPLCGPIAKFYSCELLNQIRGNIQLQPVLPELLASCSLEALVLRAECLLKETWMYPVTFPLLKGLLTDAEILNNTPAHNMTPVIDYGLAIDLPQIFRDWEGTYSRARLLLEGVTLDAELTAALQESELYFVLYDRASHAQLQPGTQHAIENACNFAWWSSKVQIADLRFLPLGVLTRLKSRLSTSVTVYNAAHKRILELQIPTSWADSVFFEYFCCLFQRPPAVKRCPNVSPFLSSAPASSTRPKEAIATSFALKPSKSASKLHPTFLSLPKLARASQRPTPWHRLIRSSSRKVVPT